MTSLSVVSPWTVSRGYVAVVTHCLGRLGVPVGELAIPAQQAVISQKQLWDLWESARTVTGQTGWGVRVAELLPPHPPGLMGETLAASSTLIEALGAFTHAATMLDWYPTTVTIGSSQVFVELHTDQLDYVHPEGTEFALALMVRWLWPTAERPEFSVHLRHREPSDLRPQQHAFGPNLKYRSERHGLGFDTATALSSYTGGPEESNVRATITSVASAQSRSNIVDQVGRVIAERLDGSPPVTTPTLDEVAAVLGLHPKNLNRRLASEGTSFRALLDVHRRAAALTLLNHPLSLGQIASRLGYADTPAFVRAFRRWTGVAPGAYRSRSGSVRS